MHFTTTTLSEISNLKDIIDILEFFHILLLTLPSWTKVSVCLLSIFLNFLKSLLIFFLPLLIFITI